MIKSHQQMPLLTPESGWRAPTDLPDLRGCKRIAVDVETCDPTLATLGPGVRSGGYIAGLAVGTDRGGRWYLPIRHHGGDNLNPDRVLQWAFRELNAFDGEIVGTNILYDLDYLAEVGVTFPHVKRFLDVQTAEPLLDENRLSFRLDVLAEHYLGENKREAMLKEAAIAYGFGGSVGEMKSNLWRLPARYVGAYAEGDVDLPLRVLACQEPLLEAQGLNPIFDVETRLVPLLLAMRRRGVAVDVEGAERVRARLIKARDDCLAEVKRLAGPQAELMEPESFYRALMDRGLPVPVTPKTKKPSVKKEWLAQYKDDELVSAIMRGRVPNTLINTFLDGHVLGHAVNGRIHCEFIQLKRDEGGTIARFASANPNLQNLPSRDGELAPLVRGLFVPEPGHLWAQIDLSQIEYRLLVHYARGVGAREARQQYIEDDKTDFHKLAATMAGLDVNDKLLRKRIKIVNFTKVYGGGIPKLAMGLECDLQAAKQFSDNYDRRLPFVKKTFDEAMGTAELSGEVHTVLGRIQRFPLWEPIFWENAERRPVMPREQAEKAFGDKIRRALTYAALNRVLQGSAADLLKKAMVDIWESGLCDDDMLGPPLLTVHDELDFDAPDTTEGREALLEAKHLMEVAVPLQVPVKAEMEIGANWGECLGEQAKEVLQAAQNDALRLAAASLL